VIELCGDRLTIITALAIALCHQLKCDIFSGKLCIPGVLNRVDYLNMNKIYIHLDMPSVWA
jgi:hypothetical protein